MKLAVAFALGYLRDPRRVGAIAPASRALAAAVASTARENHPALIIEAGAGTGAITAQIVHRCSGTQHIVVYERDARYANHLKERYPGLEICNQCVSSARRLLREAGQPVSIVSSLPLLSMPQQEKRCCIDTFLELLAQHPDSRLVQYTYAHPWQRPFSVVDANLHWRRTATIWANLPPAHVWVLARHDAFSKRGDGGAVGEGTKL
jgi:phosphatidylethanolamine/phosphatidyl-N-methylethanolamine N-methyltransferase